MSNQYDDRKQSRLSPLTNALTNAIEKALKEAMFCLPGRITAFDPETQLAQVECGIQRYTGEGFETIAVIQSVPVQFSGDSEWYFWHQITPGETEGIVHFSQRAIDTWVDRGGPVAPHSLRVLSPSDAFFVPGIRSRPHMIPNFKNDGAGIGNYEQDTFIHAQNGGVIDIESTAAVNVTTPAASVECETATIDASASMDVTAPLTTFNGDVLVNGSVTWTGTAQGQGGPAQFSGGLTNAGGDIVSDGFSLTKHPHNQGADSAGDAQVQTDPPTATE